MLNLLVGSKLFLVLVVAFGNALLVSLIMLATRRAIPIPEQYARYRWIFSLLQEASSLLLLAYVLFRRRKRFRDLGLRWSFGDAGSGLVVAVAAYLAYAAGHYLTFRLHSALYAAAPSGLTASEVFGRPSILVVPQILLNPFFEELIVRAYVMTEVIDLTGSATVAIFLSVAVQTAYHLYYGWAQALSMSFMFLVYSIYYARTRKATPIVVAHGIFDILGFIGLL